VCVSLCTRATDHSFRVRNLIFGLSDPWNIRKKRFFLFFEIFIFTLSIGLFRFFPYITLVHFLFQATGHIFSPRNVIFGLREPCSIQNWRLLTFFENSIFHGPFFWLFFNMTLVILNQQGHNWLIEDILLQQLFRFTLWTASRFKSETVQGMNRRTNSISIKD